MPIELMIQGADIFIGLACAIWSNTNFSKVHDISTYKSDNISYCKMVLHLRVPGLARILFTVVAYRSNSKYERWQN